jgi:hypothetical protein
VLTVDWQVDQPLDTLLYTALHRARTAHHVRSVSR